MVMSQLDVSRRRRNILKYFVFKNEAMYRSSGEGGCPLCGPMVDMRYEREGAG